MASKLVNVRLDEKRLRKARALRANGIALSDVVREAIDARHAEVSRLASPVDVTTVMRSIFERHPDPPRLPDRGYEVHDRRAAASAIRRRLRRRRHS